MPNMTESEVFDKFAQIVAESSRVEAWRIGRDTHLNDLGALHGISHAVFAGRQEITLHSAKSLTANGFASITIENTVCGRRHRWQPLRSSSSFHTAFYERFR